MSSKYKPASLFHICTQLLWWPNASRRQPLWSTCLALTSLSVTSAASTRPFSAGPPLACAGAWTAAAHPSKARPCGDAQTVQEVKHSENDLWRTVAMDKKRNQRGLVYVSSLSSPYDASAPEGDGRRGRWRWVQQIKRGSLHGDINRPDGYLFTSFYRVFKSSSLLFVYFNSR